MPCWTITTTKLDLSKANALVLKYALTDLGLEIDIDTANKIVARRGNTTITWLKGKGTTVKSTDNSIAEELPKRYSQTAIAYAAKINKWTVTQKDENNYAVVRY